MRIEDLLAPIAGDAPTGISLSYSPAFDAINEMRREDDPTLAQGDWVAELKVANWQGVLRDCEALLRTQSKDLRLSAWWTEAAIRVNGYAGLADGLLLNRELLARFWEALHPQLENGDADERIGNLAWLLSRIEALALLAPVLQLGRQRLTLRDVDEARAERVPSSGEERPTLSAIQRALAQLGSAAFEAQLAALRQAQEALRELQAEVDRRFGSEGPGFSKAHKALDQASDALRRLGRDSGLGLATPASDDMSEPAQAQAANEAGLPAATHGGPPQTRAQALRQLGEVAAYFRRTEPHSPVAYLAEKAARWGEMPLHAWLRQVVKDDATLARLDEMLGVENPPG